MSRSDDAGRQLTRRRVLGLAGISGLVLLSAGCDRAHHAQSAEQPPVDIGPGDTCAVCGMEIDRFPGPRGEAYVEVSNRPLKFCSTRDFFAWVLQPEHTGIAGRRYVQDMAQNLWRRPRGHWIDARTAWYVADQPLPGAMGPTFASFARRADAAGFVGRHGGRVLRYAEITPDSVSLLRRPAAPPGSGAGAEHPNHPRDLPAPASSAKESSS